MGWRCGKELSARAYLGLTGQAACELLQENMKANRQEKRPVQRLAWSRWEKGVTWIQNALNGLMSEVCFKAELPS